MSSTWWSDTSLTSVQACSKGSSSADSTGALIPGYPYIVLSPRSHPITYELNLKPGDALWCGKPAHLLQPYSKLILPKHIIFELNLKRVDLITFNKENFYCLESVLDGAPDYVW